MIRKGRRSRQGRRGTKKEEEEKWGGGGGGSSRMLKDPDQERRCCKKAEYEKKIIWKLGRQTPCCWRRHCVESFRWSFSSYYSVEKGGDFNGTFLCIGLFSLSLFIFESFVTFVAMAKKHQYFCWAFQLWVLLTMVNRCHETSPSSSVLSGSGITSYFIWWSWWSGQLHQFPSTL